MNARLSPIFGTVESDIVSELASFIEDQVRRQCTRIVLAQRVGETLHPVNEWLTTEMLDARSLASALHATGLREAQTLRESVAYAVFSIRADSPAPVGRFVFRIEAGTWLGTTAASPDERGIIAMLMQHTESSARLSLGHSREIVDQYQTLLVQDHAHNTRLLEQAYARIRVLEAREAEALDLREKLQSHAMERNAQLDALKRKDEMRQFAIEKLGPAVPMLLARFLGGSAANETAAKPAGGAVDAAAAAAAANVGEELVDRLIDSMTPDQVNAIAKLLTQEQLVFFGQIYELSLLRIQRAQQQQASGTGGASADTQPARSPGDSTASPPDPNPQPSPKDSKP